jgi:hypothetical protein
MAIIQPETILEQVRGKTLKSMKHICFEASRSLTPEDAFKLAEALLPNPDVHGHMAATLIAGHISYLYPPALAFLRGKSAANDDSRVQDALARALDHYCLNKGYEEAMATLADWGKDPNPNVRRAAIEAPRYWTKKDYFIAHPEAAIEFVAGFKNDANNNVRFSAGRVLAEISEDFPDLVLKELRSWNLHHPPIKNTYQFAAKHLHAKMGMLFTG